MVSELNHLLALDHCVFLFGSLLLGTRECSSPLWCTGMCASQTHFPLSCTVFRIRAEKSARSTIALRVLARHDAGDKTKPAPAGQHKGEDAASDLDPIPDGYDEDQILNELLAEPSETRSEDKGEQPVLTGGHFSLALPTPPTGGGQGRGRGRGQGQGSKRTVSDVTLHDTAMLAFDSPNQRDERQVCPGVCDAKLFSCLLVPAEKWLLLVGTSAHYEQGCISSKGDGRNKEVDGA